MTRRPRVEIDLAPIADVGRLAAIWQDLEQRADGSFFQSWAWTGCLAAERFSDPLLLTAREDGVVIAAALFNRRSQRLVPPTLWLGESGDPRQDDVFIEHNGVLIERGRSAPLLAACLRTAASGAIGAARPRRRRLVVSGVGAEYLAAARAAGSPVRVRAARPAPFVDLDALRRSGRNPLDGASGNTRYQIRRSERRYRALGPLVLRRARSLDEAQDFLSELRRLHQATWIGRGKPGAFANPGFERFHRALIGRSFAEGGVDLLRATAGKRVIGYLYNFCYRGHVYAYQSGFDYELADAQRKPGLVCHHLALELYLAEGARRYDFLAGADRYKLSLATGSVDLHWLEIGGEGVFRRLGAAALTMAGRLLRRSVADL
ncbi:MAG TPA: GNAT family N-acetyltransferase [Stellaceae bacterium]|nr:GNAT family N-acetyltransferase [Stellaceae bacterium]